MDLRIVNTCNNNCSYCLEQSLRKKEKFIDSTTIFSLLEKQKNKQIINFYGGNPLLHPELLEIISFAKSIGFEQISLLSNTFGLDNRFLTQLDNSGLTHVGAYFNNFDEKKHNLIVGKSGITLSKLLENIRILLQHKLQVKIIIHINNQNIQTVYKDVLILNKKYGIRNFEFVNYFPFDRPYDQYKNMLEYSTKQNIQNILKLFKILKKLKIQTNFVKFSKDFFGNYIEFYDFKEGVLDQIGDEDSEVLESSEEPYCLKQGRCNNCFLKDYCKWYNTNKV